MTQAQQTSLNTSAAQQFDGAEFVVRVLDCGAVIYEEVDVLTLDLDYEAY